ncbi:hypothetical protein OSB04_022418 [Centaurea solstitialis]|uniref:Uncharacterized protein n=1 Tax=Centaurea solstitialis TaxID=347529 RepID=A0AA38WF49_9ASTR|nr:hypothetical protein OSB04_022418 [Centaurea solstitialis]
MVTVWLIWQRRNRFVNSTQDDAVKILQEDLFPTVQRLTILWISYRKPDSTCSYLSDSSSLQQTTYRREKKNKRERVG